MKESFRDLKNTLNGLGLRHCRSYQKGRLNVALLLGAITFFILWIVGVVAKVKQVHRRSSKLHKTSKRIINFQYWLALLEGCSI